MIKEFDYIEEENIFVRKKFNIEEILKFQSEHDIQIIRGSDWQYECWIDKECYEIALTFMYALLMGIEKYNLERANKYLNSITI